MRKLLFPLLQSPSLSTNARAPPAKHPPVSVPCPRKTFLTPSLPLSFLLPYLLLKRPQHTLDLEPCNQSLVRIPEQTENEYADTGLSIILPVALTPTSLSWLLFFFEREGLGRGERWCGLGGFAFGGQVFLVLLVGALGMEGEVE